MVMAAQPPAKSKMGMFALMASELPASLHAETAIKIPASLEDPLTSNAMTACPRPMATDAPPSARSKTDGSAPMDSDSHANLLAEMVILMLQ
jgi:hypothetical protein